jgi:ATP-dependent helicase HepA
VASPDRRSPHRARASGAELHTGRDRLLELNSGGAGEGDALVEAILEQDDQFALPIYMETLFDAFGIDSEDHSENALILKPSEKMLDASFPWATTKA